MKGEDDAILFFFCGIMVGAAIMLLAFMVQLIRVVP